MKSSNKKDFSIFNMLMKGASFNKRDFNNIKNKKVESVIRA